MVADARRAGRSAGPAGHSQPRPVLAWCRLPLSVCASYPLLGTMLRTTQGNTGDVSSPEGIVRADGFPGSSWLRYRVGDCLLKMSCTRATESLGCPRSLRVWVVRRRSSARRGRAWLWRRVRGNVGRSLMTSLRAWLGPHYAPITMSTVSSTGWVDVHRALWSDDDPRFHDEVLCHCCPWWFLPLARIRWLGVCMGAGSSRRCRGCEVCRAAFSRRMVSTAWFAACSASRAPRSAWRASRSPASVRIA
ncbi:hypothetical protein EV192_1284 [Actinocrispum wychmicini]|uniref:Uncharacterized protein n=1 Tax=Actinocrispum wychmicini TaxID=1213861 RepID=A0A4R2IG34_9PSEU|nr:hypothetical protein EV192_1284 [Actinocrispum wychmicini]